MAADPLVRPDYGPSLPAWLEARFRVPARTTITVAIVLLAIVALVVALAVRGGDTRYVNHAQPVFNLRYASDALQRPKPPPGWSLVLDARHAGKFVQSLAV